MRKVSEYFLYNISLHHRTSYINNNLKFYNPTWRVVSTLLNYYSYFNRAHPAEIIKAIDSKSRFGQISIKKLRKILKAYKINLSVSHDLLDFYSSNNAFDGLIRYTDINTHKKDYVYFRKHHSSKKCTFRFTSLEFKDYEFLHDFIAQHCYKPDIVVLKAIKIN